jgi:hypothetical protein
VDGVWSVWSYRLEKVELVSIATSVASCLIQKQTKDLDVDRLFYFNAHYTNACRETLFYFYHDELETMETNQVLNIEMKVQSVKDKLTKN